MRQATGNQNYKDWQGIPLVFDANWRRIVCGCGTWPKPEIAALAITGAIDMSALRIATKAFVILMLTSMAVSLFRTLASMSMPCSVNAYGRFRAPIFTACRNLEVAFCDIQFPSFEVANCDLKELLSLMAKLDFAILPEFATSFWTILNNRLELS